MSISVRVAGWSAMVTAGIALAASIIAAAPAAQIADSDWTSVGRDAWEQHYSPLTQVDAKTVSGLGLAWFADMDTEAAQEATPIVVDGVLYVTTAWSMVKAFDAATGAPLWAYDPKVNRKKGADACCDVVNRGVAYANGKVFLGALDGRLIALDAKTGKEVWSEQTTDPAMPYTITGVPRIARGKVIIGNGGAEYRVRGYVSGYDIDTGKRAWRWFTVPGDPAQPFEQPELKKAARTWNGEWWKLGAGGTVWDSMAYDPGLNSLYVGTGNGTPWNQALRSPGGGDNLYLASVVALDPGSGKYKCHFQETPGETWDYTSTQPIIVATLKYKSGPRKVLLHAPKNGFFYVLDAKTCQPVSVEKYAFSTWATGWDKKTNRPIENPAARFDKTGKPVILTPFAQGLHNWHPMAFSPATGLVYLPVTVSNAIYAPAKDFKVNLKGWNTGTDFAAGRDLYKQPGAPKPGEIESYILAWNPVTQKEVWRAPNTAFGATGVVATAGNLIFSGNHAGEFAAYDAATGKRLWTAPAGARVVAAPAAYAINGKQYVAVLVGARGLPKGQSRTSASSGNNSRLLVFALGGTATLPTRVADGTTAAAKAFDPPLSSATPETIAAGAQAYASNCAACHGANGAAGEGAIAPDLRYSALLRDQAQWNRIVIHGERAARGMPGFGKTLATKDSDAILAYVIKRANDAKAGGQ